MPLYSLKTKFANCFNDDEIVTFLRDEQFENASFPIEITDEGTEILSSEE